MQHSNGEQDKDQECVEWSPDAQCETADQGRDGRSLVGQSASIGSGTNERHCYLCVWQFWAEIQDKMMLARFIYFHYDSVEFHNSPN